jgi:CMP/dCMP kinase
MIIAIDGPAGAGKSTVARATAARLGFTYLDSGALYRCVALAVIERGRAPAEVAKEITIELDKQVLLDGRDVTAAIRTAEVSLEASRVSEDPVVREVLSNKQRELLALGNLVVEGRDIGTVVAPEAAVKVFLTASPQERARRRAEELDTDTETVLKDQLLRDQRDMQRAHAPLQPAPDAVPVDSTGLSIDETVDQIVTLVIEVKELM